MEKERKTFSFGLRTQLMLFTTVLALITYSTSLFFIYVIYDYFQIYVSRTVYNIIVMLLGVVWSGILAYGAAIFLIKPLRKLEEAARKAADGDIREDVPLPKVDDEIKSLSVASHALVDVLDEVELPRLPPLPLALPAAKLAGHVVLALAELAEADRSGSTAWMASSVSMTRSPIARRSASSKSPSTSPRVRRIGPSTQPHHVERRPVHGLVVAEAPRPARPARRSAPSAR